MQPPLSEIVKLWSNSSRLIRNRFRLESPFPPSKSVRVDDESTLRIGGYYDASANEIRLSNETVRGTIPIDAIIAREVLFSALPPILCDESRRDLGMEYARQILRKNEKRQWLKVWKTLPSRRIRANLVYDSFELMSWMFALGGEKELDTLVHELVSMARYGKSLSFDEYIEYMNRRAQDIVVKLSRTEVRIIDAILKNQGASYRHIAKALAMSESWVSKQIGRLKHRYVLIGLTSIPFSRIGLRTFHVMLAGSAEDDPTRFIAACPFLFNVRRILNGPWQILARLAVPDNLENVRSLDLMASSLNDVGIAVDISETHSAGLSNSFRHYNVSNRRWEIPWVAMQGWGQRIADESLHKIVNRIDTPAKTIDVYLDEIDLRILGSIRKQIVSTRAMRSHLSIGQNQLSKRLKRLRSNGLLRRVWDVYNIGLVERVALKTTDAEMGSILDAWLREFPRTNLRYGERRDLLMVVDLPIGGSTRLMDTIMSLKWPVIVSPLGSGVWGQWQFPEHLWDVETQSWNAARPAIESWFDNLERECESSVPTLSKQHQDRTLASRR